MIGAALGMVFDVVFASAGHAAGARLAAADVRRLQRQGVLRCALRAVDGRLGRFGDTWLSSDWHVSPGRIHVGSTTVVVDSVDPDVRTDPVPDFYLAGLPTVVLTVRGPGTTVEVVMLAESEDWFRDAVAPRRT